MPPTHFVLTPVGSAGDVHPFIGIGRALKARGHDVTLITAEPFRGATERAGLRFVGTQSQEDFDRLTQMPDLWHSRRGMAIVLGAVATVLRQDYERIAEVYEPDRSVLVGSTMAFAARVFEEKHAAPAATCHLAPSLFRSDYEQPTYIPGTNPSALPRWAKRTVWWLVDRLMIDRAVLPSLNAWRRDLGLPAVSRILREWVHSPRRVIALFPEWFAKPQPDWPPQLRVTGFPLYDADEGTASLSPNLEAFLGNGSPPIVFTPGSANRMAAAFFKAALDAVRRLNRRAVFLTSYPEQVPGELGPDVHYEQYVPFSRIVPRSAAFVHHGGIGTSAQGLAAGIPQLVMPLGYDQPDNATRLWRLGVSRWIMPDRFTAERAAETLTTLLNDAQVAERCAHWAGLIRSSNTMDCSCRLLEELSPVSGAAKGSVTSRTGPGSSPSTAVTAAN